ncbi:MAG: 3'-5' exoribonuclease YhaM family protein [Planctomycetota bacterium]
MTAEGTPLNPPSGATIPVAQLRKGARISGGVYLVQESNFKQTRNGKYFIQLTLRDRTGAIRAVRWEATAELFESFASGDLLRVHGRVEEFQGQLQVVVDGLERVPPEEIEEGAYLPVSERSPEEMEKELLGAVASVGDPHLKALLVAFLDDPEIRSAFLRCPAGKTVHHAYLGGLAEHVLSIIGAARSIAKNYPSLNLDILIAAAILHDIGKIRELAYARGFGYTDEGQLIGHIAIGLLLLAEKAAAVPDFPRELLLHLQHIIVSHHGAAEYGAVKPPMTAEAIAFHYLDNLDAKLAMVDDLKKDLESAEKETERERRWTDFKPALGRKIFFPD